MWNTDDDGAVVAQPLESFEVATGSDGVVLVRFQLGGRSVQAALGPVHASYLAKQLRMAATEVHATRPVLH